MKRIHKQVVVSNPCVEENGFFLNENDKMTASPAFETSCLYYLPIDLSHRKKCTDTSTITNTTAPSSNSTKNRVNVRPLPSVCKFKTE